MPNQKTNLSGNPTFAALETSADPARGEILAAVDLAAPPERVFRALTSEEICSWWVRPGVFDTREWRGDVRAGGRWQASGIGNGHPYTLAGEFLEVEPPVRLAQTWQMAGAPDAPTVVTYALEPLAAGTRLTLRHSGFASEEDCTDTCIGWQTSLRCLVERLAAGST